MPKRKITLEEAYAAFEEHGLEVEVKAVQGARAVESLQAFLESSPNDSIALAEEHEKTVKVTLYASHTIGNGGEIVVDNLGNKSVVNNGVQQYGPGVINVPRHLAQHLLHQDLLARRADERLLENSVRTYIVRPMRTAQGSINVARHVSSDNSFDLSGFLGRLGDGGTYSM